MMNIIFQEVNAENVILAVQHAFQVVFKFSQIFEAEGEQFKNCYSQNCGGGGIYIFNNIENPDATYTITLKHLTFRSCKGYFGGDVTSIPHLSRVQLSLRAAISSQTKSIQRQVATKFLVEVQST